MTAPAYYNEIDPYAAQWLRNLVAAGEIAPGEVDERDIRDVRPDELAGYAQCHFFAGIGVWSHALRRAGWPDDRPVWTGSCPCQPFSVAGRRKGTDDDRHLWPIFSRLIAECLPPIVFGEQVASAEVVGRSGKRPRVSARLPAATPGEGSDPAREEAGGGQGDLLRFGRLHEPYSGEDRRGLLRGDWPALQSGGRQDMGQPLAGSNEPIAGLHVPEHPCGLPRREQRDGRLGGTTASGVRPRNLGEAAREVKRILAVLGREADGDHERAWLDAVFDDLETAGYACGAHVFPASGVGAPHIRQRLFWVADAQHRRCQGRYAIGTGAGAGVPRGEAGGVGHPDGDRRASWGLSVRPGRPDETAVIERRNSKADGVADGYRRNQGQWLVEERAGLGHNRGDGRPGPTSGFWADADWIFCRDETWRPVGPGAFPLAHGAPARVGRLRAYGNAIVAPAAVAFVEAVMAEIGA